MTRFIDIVLSLIAIVVLLPFMIPIVIGLKLTGEHHVFYKQTRVGKGGKEFGLMKFATMLENSQYMPGGLTTLKDDPRVLPMGRLLRKTKINELPQLINILVGDMSVIGFRPPVPKIYMKWPESVKEKLKDCKPGLSGIGSIVFRNEEEILQEIENKEQFYMDAILPYKMELEAWYSNNNSIFLYWELIFFTIDAVLGGKKWKRIKGLPEIPDNLKGII